MNRKLCFISSILLFSLASFSCSRQMEPSASDLSVTTEEQDSISVTPDPIEEWSANHGIAEFSIETYDKNEHDITEIYVYINDTEGWKANYESVESTSDESVVLYKTIDGGSTWDEIANSKDPETSIINGVIMFNNSNLGWMTKRGNDRLKDAAAGEKAGIYKTIDGGVTWNYQAIDVPSEYSGYVIDMPVFFSQEDGIIFASCLDKATNTRINAAVTTHDGGESWDFYPKDKSDGIFSWNVSSSETTPYEVIFNNEIWSSNSGLYWDKSPYE